MQCSAVVYSTIICRLYLKMISTKPTRYFTSQEKIVVRCLSEALSEALSEISCGLVCQVQYIVWSSRPSNNAESVPIDTTALHTGCSRIFLLKRRLLLQPRHLHAVPCPQPSLSSSPSASHLPPPSIRDPISQQPTLRPHSPTRTTH